MLCFQEGKQSKSGKEDVFDCVSRQRWEYCWCNVPQVTTKSQRSHSTGQDGQLYGLLTLLNFFFFSFFFFYSQLVFLSAFIVFTWKGQQTQRRLRVGLGRCCVRHIYSQQDHLRTSHISGELTNAEDRGTGQLGTKQPSIHTCGEPHPVEGFWSINMELGVPQETD